MKKSSPFSIHLVLTSLFLLGLVACGGGSSGDTPSTSTPSDTPSTSTPSDTPSTSTPSDIWTWMSGSDVVNQWGTYGTKGTGAASNVPGARQQAVSWTDSNSNLWLFGGSGYDSAGTLGNLNDLWKFDGTNWTWVSGSDVVNQSGVYESAVAADNVPGARYDSISWTDSSGNLWLFGGIGYDSVAATNGYLNDLWKYDGTNWTWVSGSNTRNQSGVYAAVNVADNVPGARRSATSWIDSSGNLWLFGGTGYDSAGAVGLLNDLWKFDGTNWIWVSGSDVVNQASVYGTQGVADSANVPGGRGEAVGWTDSNDNLWLFGGGLDFSYNDLWKFDGVNWTWMSGSNMPQQAGVYDGATAADNVPGARRLGAIGWIDSNDNLWLFSGIGFDKDGVEGYLSDLWKYDGTNWIWVSGSDTRNQIGVYAGATTADNVPGGRGYAVSWIDSGDNLWLFSGYGYYSLGAAGRLNDLWRYQP